MSDKSAIEWTDASWNPVRGCSIVSKGCTNCYAMKFAHRFSGPGKAFEGLTTLSKGGPVWNGKIKLVPEMLDQPLRWKRPRMIFVNSMSDLYHEDVPDEFINKIFDVMEQSREHHWNDNKKEWVFGEGHTFQILTKRPERMMKHAKARLARKKEYADKFKDCPTEAMRNSPAAKWAQMDATSIRPHIWLGVSAEDYKTYKERVLYLANTPAAIRFVSFEPLLSDIGDLMLDGVYEGAYQWGIVGGESGPGARPMVMGYAKSIIRQLKAAGVAPFMKQMGAHPTNREGVRCPHIKHPKGADMVEWPEELRVREFPA